MQSINERIAAALSIPQAQVNAAVRLMDEGNTVPFIARYRKEVTGSLDDTQLRDISDKLSSLRNLEKRRGEIEASIDSQGAMTEELRAAIQNAATLSALEDLYLPYKKKRNTRASIAKAKGLEPLADRLAEQNAADDPAQLAAAYVNAASGVADVKEALQGASDILAERIADNARVRGSVRLLMERTGVLHSTSEHTEDGTYSMYYDHAEKLREIAPHRLLAICRGEKEGVLKAALETDPEACLTAVRQKTVTAPGTKAGDFVLEAGRGALKRLIYPSLENELRAHAFDAAAEQAISVFKLNLRPLLMQPPLKNRVVMGFDPAYRTGCKIAVVDETGKVLDVTVVYPTPPQNKTAEAKKTLAGLIEKHRVTAIAVGNGTAGKESEIFIADMLKDYAGKVEYAVVSEAGASVYSASKLGAEEFPQYDASLRSAVSIARRLQDPLAELVKIDPRSIGVGQYQHDMKQSRLGEALSGVVEYCVNHVGVDINTASYSLLSHVAGINAASAKNIVKYREENGAFTSRAQIKKVPRIGARAFEQCAGFLRVSGGREILDETGVHPESYAAARALLDRFSLHEEDVRRGNVIGLDKAVREAGEAQIAYELGVGIPTLRDIVAELSKPGRDARDELPAPILRTDVLTLDDLSEGMELTGTVRNVVDFGAFVDIGVHQDGLVHISQISKKRIAHPSEVLAIGDIVKVKIISLDRAKGRIGLTMKF